jgi:outer membrane protein, multidrug efflux system
MVESAQASSQQAGDDLANARLVLTAELATDYFALRELDNEIDVVNQSVGLQQKALDFVNAQHDLGAVSGLELLQQKAQLAATQTQVHLLENQRQQDEHAIAVLVGKPAPEFVIEPKVTPLPVPALPTGLPSELLQRRPDVASAERAMASANAQIGVARSAYFPDITLSPTLGWESTRFGGLFSVPSLMWSVGATAGEVLFDGGKRAAGVDFAQAGYESAQASYRQTVLTAFQEVQNAVTGLSVLERASTAGQAAVDDARQSFDLANDRYQGGLVAFIDVLNAEQQLLASERQEVQIHGQQVATVVFLAKALGGGWSADETGLACSAGTCRAVPAGGAQAPKTGADMGAAAPAKAALEEAAAAGRS